MSISHSASRPAASLIFVRPWAFSPSLSGCATLPLVSSLPVPTPPPAEVLSSGSAWLATTTSCNLACCKRSSAILRSRLFCSARSIRPFNCGSRNVRHHCHRSGLAPPDAGSLPAGGTTKAAGTAASGVKYSGPRAQPDNATANTTEHARLRILMRMLPENHISLVLPISPTVKAGKNAISFVCSRRVYLGHSSELFDYRIGKRRGKTARQRGAMLRPRART
jgi:hypothetical protein